MNQLLFVLILPLTILSLQLLAVTYQVSAQQPIQNLPFCTKVGDAPGPNPCLTDQQRQLTSGGGVVSCPVPESNGRILTGSYYSKLGTSQHCNATSGYGNACSDPRTRRAKSVDVPTLGKAPILPAINNQIVEWKYLQQYDDSLGGWAYVFRTTDNQGTNWDLQLLHLDKTSNSGLSIGQYYKSGTPVAINALGFTHTHITLGKNIINPLGSCGADRQSQWSNLTICNTIDPGWLNADIDVGLCI